MLLNRFVLLPLAMVLAVQVGLAPLHLYYFQQINLFAPGTNLIGIPITGLALFGALLTSMLGWVPLLGSLLASFTQIWLNVLLFIVQGIEGLPLVTVNMRPLPLWFMVAYYVLILSSYGILTGRGTDLRLTRRQGMNLAWRMALVVLLVIWTPLLTASRRRALDLYVLDVGQGDGMVLRFPNGRVMVVDAGRSAPYDQGRFTVGPFLETLGVTRIDCLTATHADADHIGGLPYLLEHFDVGTWLEGPDISTSDVFGQMRSLLGEQVGNVLAASVGARLAGMGPVEVTLLGPAPGLDDNDASLVMLIDHGDVEILLTGDIEAVAERSLLGSRQARDIEILKVAHHGSKTSTTEAFLEAFGPEVGLISAGRRNRYGHPAPEVLERLGAHGVRVFRTDRDGTIWVRTDGRMVRIYRFAGPA